jgi:hypothetical protein
MDRERTSHERLEHRNALFSAMPAADSFLEVFVPFGVTIWLDEISVTSLVLFGAGALSWAIGKVFGRTDTTHWAVGVAVVWALAWLVTVLLDAHLVVAAIVGIQNTFAFGHGYRDGRRGAATEDQTWARTSHLDHRSGAAKRNRVFRAR